MIDTASVRGLSGDDLDFDIVVLDRSVLDMSSAGQCPSFPTWGINIPILFINGSASLTKQANSGAGVLKVKPARPQGSTR